MVRTYRYSAFYRWLSPAGGLLFTGASIAAAVSGAPTAALGTLILGAFAALSWYVTYTLAGEIETSAEGITHRRFGSSTHIAWPDLRCVEHQWGGLRLTGDTVTMRIEQQVDGYIELYAELRRYAPAAFQPPPQIPLTITVSRLLFVWMAPVVLLVLGRGIYGIRYEPAESHSSSSVFGFARFPWWCRTPSGRHPSGF